MEQTPLKKKFISFFTQKPRNHRLIPSSPLIPENDPTVLFITAGMHPLVPYLLGEPHPLGKRLVSIQKSVRTDDIDEVGDLRHFTFFEMLGNWSLGDYFKEEAIRWSFEFLTSGKWLNLDPYKIYVTVFEGDQDAPKDRESISIWQEVFFHAGVKALEGKPEAGLNPHEKIFPYPKKNNWWGPAGETGPCGPDTEMFYDTGLPFHDEKRYGGECHPNCDCGRFIEIWNDVFMQYNKQPDGSFAPLSKKNVDTGMGLERMVSILSYIAKEIPSPDPFLTPLFSDLILNLEKISSRKYEGGDTKYFRIICDHIRAATFITADGIVPGNKERGYVLRRIIRRAVRSGTLIGLKNNFLTELSESVLRSYGNDYPELKQNRAAVLKEIGSEESRFRSALERGMKEINKYPALNGKNAFDLYQNFGIPLEMTVEIAHDRGEKIDRKSFEEEFKKHQNLSRQSAKGIFKGGLADASENTTRLHTATHLLQQSLRTILGNHVRQKGSHITQERLRFDFIHDKKLSPEEITAIEKMVNEKIRENIPVSMEILTIEQAIREHALTVPGTKYPEKVKVYTINKFSKEVCGGPHVNFTGILGKFKIIKEEAAGSHIRRIYATLTF